MRGTTRLQSPLRDTSPLRCLPRGRYGAYRLAALAERERPPPTKMLAALLPLASLAQGLDIIHSDINIDSPATSSRTVSRREGYRD